ncbi:MAG: UDP-4-amino-4,6-dideoxy-N-acetyl-beta-L-altrosamine transaminase [Chloroflexota bacterium]
MSKVSPTKETRHIPYGQQWLDDEDIEAVVTVLRSDWLTTGPKVAEFEEAFARFVGAQEAVAVSNGTASLHAAINALDIGPGDEVIVPTMTFAATANCILFEGGTPIFVDVEPETLLIDPARVEAAITERTKAIIAVDYAGQPCDYDALQTIANQHNLALIDDACHAIGGTYKGRSVGILADLNTFSFHPVKHIATGEGGMITTNSSQLAKKMRTFRNHGITTDHRQRAEQGSWFYEMVDLGYNYRLTDIQCALGLTQLRKLPEWVTRRQTIAQQYNQAFRDISGLTPLTVRPEVNHAYHLYVVRLDLNLLVASRSEIFTELREAGLGVNVHYIPVHRHPFYQKRFGYQKGLCPVAEAAYEQILSLPMFPKMSDDDVQYVIDIIERVLRPHLQQAG